MENSESLIPTAEISDTDHGLVVNYVWPGVDRPCSFGIGINGNSRKLAERLVAAIEAGVAYSTPEVRTDNNGQTYVSMKSNVMARCLSADLSRLGF